eukprot:CAMPEP_0201600184 /NCGR_PEP_ID=MMETSP0492-20130828/1353_1 /ASSEMBLY_ACC=CAM_ASM_000837 /TAXON_ID=420259 /ORGANISM="Thalassiosira gravida, Strain GMp14c1" /LENGTH=258 /DNA_ID=CAMNT_0048062901 /DNA_START=128 /DNA_END=904 /DNA_ORIENTATION=-
MNATKTNLMVIALAILATSSRGFTAPASIHRATTTTATATTATATATAAYATTPDNEEEGNTAAATTTLTRRSILTSLLSTAAATAAATVGASSAFAVDETMERGGVKLTPFNSLAFNYREGESPTVDPDAIEEASIPYADFLEELAADRVAFVEFLAPNGDTAYATLKRSAPVPAPVPDSSSGDGASESSDTDAAGVVQAAVPTTTTTESKPIRIGEGYPIEDPEGWSSPAFVIKAVAKKGVPYKFVVPGLGDSFKL